MISPIKKEFECINTNYNKFNVRYIVERGGKIDQHSNNNQVSM